MNTPEKNGQNYSWKTKMKIIPRPNLFEPGQIEFWEDRNRLKTYKFQEIMESMLLFPILNIEEIK